MLLKTRSGLAPVFQRPEWKLAVSFVLGLDGWSLPMQPGNPRQHYCHYIPYESVVS